MKKRENTHYQDIEEIYFKEFIFNCLRQEDIINHKDIKQDAQTKIFDAFLPRGFLDYTKGETYLKIFYSNNIDKVEVFIKEKQEQLGRFQPQMIIISLVDDENKTNKYKPNCIILGIGYIKSIIDKYPVEFWNFITHIDPHAELSTTEEWVFIKGKIIAGFLLEQKIDKKILSSSILNKLNEETFMKEKLKRRPALILGNGVSMSYANSDGWRKMINNLLKELQPKYFNNKSQIINHIGDSDYFKTALVKEAVGDYKYYKGIKTCIYNHRRIFKNKTDLLESLCKVKETNKGIPILTYNYDCFFEDEYKKTYGRELCTVYDKKTNSRRKSKIIHLHGFFDKTDNIPKGKNSFVLTDVDYFNAYNKKSGWVVSTQKRYLKNFTCLFVGSSMTDLYQLNVIREVNNNSNRNEQYYENNGVWYCYALLKLDKDIPELGKLRIMQYYNFRGIKIIFVNNHSDIGKKVRDLFA